MNKFHPRQRQNRIAFVDALKCFAIYLVVWGHVIQYLQPVPCTDVPMYRVIYSFHMPLFMMLSGYFSVRMLNRNWKTVIQQKAIQLLLPIVVFSLVFNALIGGGNFAPALYRGYWFLKSLFLCIILYYSINKLVPKNKTLAIVLSILISQCIPIWQFNRMYPCFVTGILMSMKSDWILKNSKKLAIYSGLVFFTMLCFFGSSFWDSLSTESMDSILKYMFQHFYRLVIGLAGAGMFFCLFYCISLVLDRTSIGDRILNMGQDTLGIYVVQTIILETYLPRLLNFEDIDTTVFSLIVAPLLAFLLTIICVICVRLLRKWKVTRLLFLGEVAKKR